MKILVASDIHGDASKAKELLAIYKSKACEKLILLGDILYHGPRNDLPRGYAPKEVIELLNNFEDEIVAVRGNCDAEVDQMVLTFPIMADYLIEEIDGVKFFITHGHRFNTENPPHLDCGDVLLHGHTHVPAVIPFANKNLYLNPGSTSIPKEGNPPSYAIIENGEFTVYSFSGNLLLTKRFI